MKLYVLMRSGYDSYEPLFYHESEEFIKKFISDVEHCVKVNNKEPYKVKPEDYINKDKIKEIKNDISSLDALINSYTTLVRNNIDVQKNRLFLKEYGTKKNELLDQIKVLKVEEADHIKQLSEEYNKQIQSSDKFSKEVEEVADIYGDDLYYEEVKHFNEF